MPAMPASRAAPTRVRQGEAMDTREPAWPALLVADWEDTRDTLQLWTQMVGKLRLALTPRVNHWWNVPLYVDARGLTTSLMPCAAHGLEVRSTFAAAPGRRAQLP